MLLLLPRLLETLWRSLSLASSRARISCCSLIDSCRRRVIAIRLKWVAICGGVATVLSLRCIHCTV